MFKIIKGKAWFEFRLETNFIIITKKLIMVTKVIIMVQIQSWRVQKDYKTGKSAQFCFSKRIK